MGFPGDSAVKDPPATAGEAGDVGLIPGLGRSSGEENGNLLQYSCLENPMDRGTWWATVQGVTKSWTRLSTHSCRSVMSDSLRPQGLQSTRLLCPWDSPGKNTGVGCHFLLQLIYISSVQFSRSVVSNSL